jgi:hypothetical protein
MKDKNNKVLILKGFYKQHLNDFISYSHPIHICETSISSFFMRIGLVPSTKVIWDSLRIINEDAFDRWTIGKIEELGLGKILWKAK